MSGEHARLGRWFSRLAKTMFQSPRTRDAVANARDGRAPRNCNPAAPVYLPRSTSGGIAQLVERQLCKLEVRGSNPLASISNEMEASGDENAVRLVGRLS